ncbi:MAG TPA: glycosyltransferase [Fimbriimonadaceae bacterium]
MESLSLSVIIDAGQNAEHLAVSLTAWKQVQEPLGIEIILATRSESAATEGYKVVVCEGSKGKRLNEAAKTASGDYLLFVKPTIIADPAAVSTLVESMARDLSIGVAAPKIVTRDGVHAPSEFILIEDECQRRPIDVLARPSRIQRDNDWLQPPLDGIAFRSDALLIRKVTLWGAGGWNEELDSDLLDITLGLSIKSQNWRVVFEPLSTVVSLAPLSAEADLTPALSQQLVAEWYGRFHPHSLRTADGVMRCHPWWFGGDGRAPFALQQVRSEFEPMPMQTCYGNKDIPGGCCSIIVVTFNSMETIKGCVESVVAFLGTFDELVLVDNDSTDETPGYLNSLIGADPRVKVILNQKNLGFSEGCNVGIRNSQGDFIVLLNPDTTVIEGWIGRMRAYFEDSRVGAVGPMSNGVCGLQQYNLHFPKNVKSGLSPNDLHDLAVKVNARRGVESKLLIGFCFMIRRNVLDQMGLLDKELFLGCDDLDLSWRLRLAGYKLMIATDVLILHKVHVSFKTLPEEVVAKYERDSANKMAAKLLAHYGKGNVPDQSEIWGIEWFKSELRVWEEVA